MTEEILIPHPGTTPDGLEPQLGNTELQINRRTTLAFIAADPLHLVLTPHNSEKTASGGMKFTPGDPKPEEVFRMIPMSDVQPSVTTPDGIQLLPTFVLMGVYSSLMDRWDTFVLNGQKYQIVSTIRPEHTIEARYFTKGDVARY